MCDLLLLLLMELVIPSCFLDSDINLELFKLENFVVVDYFVYLC